MRKMDVEDTLAPVLAGGDGDISLLELSSVKLLVSSSLEEEIESGKVASEDKEGSGDGDKDV